MGVFTKSATQTDSSPDPDAYSAPANTPRTLTAATQRIRVDDRQAMEKLRLSSQQDRAWQSRAWAAYDSVGEINYGFNLLGDLISRIRFYPAAEISPNVAPAYVNDTSDLTPGLAEAADAAIRRLSKGPGGLGAIARSLALNLSVPGECYLVQLPGTTQMTPEGVTSTPPRWEVHSTDEVIVSQDSHAPIKIRTSPTANQTEYLTLPPRSFVARIWRRHPRWSSQADSSLIALLDLVDELLLLNQTFKATARSRLNSGVFYVPDGLSASTPASALSPSSATDAPAPAEDDEFEQALIDGMMTPIQDPSDASAVVPILVRGPAELGDKIRLIQFERTFDPSLVQRADRVLERILQGIALPKDVVSGMANIRYSNAIQIEETLFKAHVEPLTLLICDALTDVYLRPSLIASGYTREQAERIRLWYDPSEIVNRPNRSQDASTAYDRYALSARAFREALGFNEDDAPNPTEIIMRMLQQKGPMTPETAEALMRVLAPNVLETARQEAQANSENPLPPEINDILNLAPGIPEETAPVIADQAPPLPPAPIPAPAAPAPPPSPQGPRAASPAAQGPDTNPAGLPPYPRTNAK